MSMPAAILLFLFAFAGVSAQEKPDPREIVRKSVDIDQSEWKKAKDYTYVEHEEERHGGKSTSKDFEVTTLYGHEFRRMIARDGKALSADDLAKEQRKYDKEVAERANESEGKRLKREAEAEKRRQEQRAFAREIPDAFDFSLSGEEKVDGRDTWVISATPRRGYQPKDDRAKALPKIKGKVWIGKEDYAWVKAQVEVIQTFRWGLFLASLNPGTIVNFAQMRVKGEVWLPKQVSVKLDARLVFKKFEGDYSTTFSNYRKFQTDSKIVSTSEIAN